VDQDAAPCADGSTVGAATAAAEQQGAAGASGFAFALAERLLDRCRTGMVACDAGGVVRMANQAGMRLLPGLEIGEVVPQPLALAQTDEIDLVVAERRLTARREAFADGWAAWQVDDVTEHQARLDSLLAERARARFLADAGARLGLSLHPHPTARAVVELASGSLAEVAVVVLPGKGGAVEWFRCGRDSVAADGRTNIHSLPGPVAQAMLGVVGETQPVAAEQLIRLAGGDGASYGARPMVLPLPGNGSPAGALVLLQGPHPASATAGLEVDDRLLGAFAQRAGLALATAGVYAQQARTADMLRRSLLQPVLPSVAGMRFGAYYRPAEEELLIGGDFYDVHAGADVSDRTTFLLGDVCGKGIDAAVSTGKVRQSVQALRRLEPDPARLLELLNDTMLESADGEDELRFVTIVLGTATPRPDGGLHLQVAGGGHLPALILRRGGRVDCVEIGGTVIGALPGAPVRRRTVELAPGESCVLYTDGVTEARGGPDGRRTFGEERLAALLAGCDTMPAAAVADRIGKHTGRWLTAGNHDDIAVLVVQAPGTAAPAEQHGAAHRHLHSVYPSIPDEEVIA
jgi:serine phosphatase RsbU (regulator of sigma subunit)